MLFFFFSSRRRHTRCALVTGVQTCALPISRALLGETRAALSDVQEWSPTALDEKVRGVAEDAEIGLGKVAQPLRAALTGRATSPGIFDVLFLLGKDESLARLSDAETATAG